MHLPFNGITYDTHIPYTLKIFALEKFREIQRKIFSVMLKPHPFTRVYYILFVVTVTSTPTLIKHILCVRCDSASQMQVLCNFMDLAPGAI